MHRPRSNRIVFAMKSGAWLFLLGGATVTGAFGVLGYALYNSQKHLLIPSLIGLAVGVGLLISYRVMSSSARCPLCAGPVLLSQRCVRHKKARTFLGSYRMRVARDIALLGAFKCPYCGEDTVCIPRDRSGRP